MEKIISFIIIKKGPCIRRAVLQHEPHSCISFHLSCTNSAQSAHNLSSMSSLRLQR